MPFDPPMMPRPRNGELPSRWDGPNGTVVLVTKPKEWTSFTVSGKLRRIIKVKKVGHAGTLDPMASGLLIVGGEKLYDKARRRETMELSPRRISIFQFDVKHSFDDRQNLIFQVVCSKGTYIISLCADLAKALGSYAHCSPARFNRYVFYQPGFLYKLDSLRFLLWGSGEYFANDAWEFNELEAAITKNYF
ncbi:unnamed protein product [Eruca vesicaria subsp. sativa]|uniref:tRNA pseudouridine(55) synthase n=1 Tax=Eruca vesicaria subsp. sativa TaxID=29727 RepID=A0ABC8LFE5_ERUVS|nr:unnamed protein product [Eruca vesicaria subsp. sativa]